MKPEQIRLRQLLTETMTLLCKNELKFDRGMRIEGVVGITLDDSDVFIVHVNERILLPKIEPASETSCRDIESTVLTNASLAVYENSHCKNANRPTDHIPSCSSGVDCEIHRDVKSETRSDDDNDVIIVRVNDAVEKRQRLKWNQISNNLVAGHEAEDASSIELQQSAESVKCSIKRSSIAQDNEDCVPKTSVPNELLWPDDSFVGNISVQCATRPSNLADTVQYASFPRWCDSSALHNMYPASTSDFHVV